MIISFFLTQSAVNAGVRCG